MGIIPPQAGNINLDGPPCPEFMILQLVQVVDNLIYLCIAWVFAGMLAQILYRAKVVNNSLLRMIAHRQTFLHLLQQKV